MALRNKGFKEPATARINRPVQPLGRVLGYGWNSLLPCCFSSGTGVIGRWGSQMHEIKFRHVNPGLRPRKTKLEMPGWAAKPEPRTDGSHEYAWHCAPFTESAQYGIEVFYPYENELHVSQKNGVLHFDGDFGEAPDDDLEWPPFRKFGSDYYTHQLLL